MTVAFDPRPGGVRMMASGVELEMLSAIPELIASIGNVGSDPAADRLFPGVYESPDDDREFRRLSEGEITSGRSVDATTVGRITDTLADDGAADLTLGEAESLARALGTARVTIAARNGMFDEPDLPAQPRNRQEVLVALLGILQEDLVEVLTDSLPG